MGRVIRAQRQRRSHGKVNGCIAHSLLLTILVWDTVMHEPVGSPLDGYTCRLARNETHVVSGSDDGKVCVWDGFAGIRRCIHNLLLILLYFFQVINVVLRLVFAISSLPKSLTSFCDHRRCSLQLLQSQSVPPFRTSSTGKAEMVI